MGKYIYYITSLCTKPLQCKRITSLSSLPLVAYLFPQHRNCLKLFVVNCEVLGKRSRDFSTWEHCYVPGKSSIKQIYNTFPYFSLLSSHSTKFCKRGTVQILAKGWFLKWAKGDNNKVLLRVEVVLCNCWEHSHCVQIRFLSLFFEPYKVSCLPLSSYNCLVKKCFSLLWNLSFRVNKRKRYILHF